jgi:hypothetical protein
MRLRPEDCEFKASMSYVVDSRLARTMYCDPISNRALRRLSILFEKRVEETCGLRIKQFST